MRASGASELRKIWYFYILKLLFLSLFCWYIRYFVGTNDMLVGLHVPTNLYIASLTLTLRKCMYSICERAERASLENFGLDFDSMRFEDNLVYLHALHAPFVSSYELY